MKVSKPINAVLGTVNLRLTRAQTYAHLLQQASLPPVPLTQTAPGQRSYQEMCLEAFGWNGSAGNNKGWFSETLTSSAVTSDPDLRQIAFAHVDCDIYSSAVDCLEFLTERLADRAFLIFDDWLPSAGHGEARAFFEWYATVRRTYRFEHVACLERGSLHLRVRRIPASGAQVQPGLPPGGES